MTSIDEGARRAADSDIAAVTELAVTAAAELAPRRGGYVWARLEARAEPLEQSLDRDHRSDDALVVVGTIDEAVVGYGVIRLVELHDGAVLGRVTDIYVMPEARGVGVGEAMMDALMDWARRRACIGVDSLALPGDRETKNFFETHGLVARAITVHHSLTDTAKPPR
ncbi:MAG: GNAT family N-acetyltransferase [Acidimicrobiaceae bacterium]|nr:GNAT family N-acetyltransferase [Acidimicrobiaceae bacterium]MCY3642565.1 GNAT family N-acetyltransferase [Acidimicrobiaceae bacterium]MDE0665561.1 GNAT family N-acetyltransferase [Acidimicrobiaceae bacterium]